MSVLTSGTGAGFTSIMTLAPGKKDKSFMKSPSACLRNICGDVDSILGGSNAPTSEIIPPQ